ncbi:MAG: hypothetical protein IKQ90_02900 [Ruminococcus sp.]|nr:hypothetical protein [Ruminococcus sp.]
MKRLFTFAAPLAAVLVMTACTSPAAKETSRVNGLDSAFTSEADITLGKLDSHAAVTRSGSGVWTAEFSSPDTLSGVKLEFTEGSVKASYKGLEMSVPQAALPVKSMMLCLIEAVDSNATAEELTGKENGKYLDISGKLDGGEYVLTVDENGMLHSFTMENNSLEITFSP